MTLPFAGWVACHNSNLQLIQTEVIYSQLFYLWGNVMNENKNNKLQAIASGAVKYSMVAIVSTLVAAFTSSLSQATPANVDIKIKIENVDVSGESTPCPTGVDKSDPDVFRGKFVKWQTYNSTYTTIEKPYKFDIYFDPVAGRPIPSNANGAAKIKVDGKAPKVKYKYTIWDRDRLCPPLDPHFRVND
jgi:hypothetical protein